MQPFFTWYFFLHVDVSHRRCKLLAYFIIYILVQFLLHLLFIFLYYDANYFYMCMLQAVYHQTRPNSYVLIVIKNVSYTITTLHIYRTFNKSCYNRRGDNSLLYFAYFSTGKCVVNYTMISWIYPVYSHISEKIKNIVIVVRDSES